MVRLHKNNVAENPQKHYIFCRTSFLTLRYHKDNLPQNNDRTSCFQTKRTA